MSAINKVLRDIRLALRTVGINLRLLAGLIAVTVTLLSLLNSYPGASRLQLLVNTFHLITMDRVLDGSQGTLPWILTLLLPILTFLILGEGFLRFISIYLNRSEHKKEWAELMAMTMKNHLILCGVGELGKEVFRRMKAGNPKLQAVLVELKPYVLAELGQAGEDVIHL